MSVVQQGVAPVPAGKQNNKARIRGYASVVVLLEGDLLLYQGGAPPTVKNLRPPLPRQLHSFFFAQGNIHGLPSNKGP